MKLLTIFSFQFNWGTVYKLLLLSIFLIGSNSYSQVSSFDKMEKAILEKDIGKVKTLLRNGVSPNSKNEKGVTVLMMASAKGTLEIVQTLVAKGATINEKTPWGTTALSLAAEYGNEDIIKWLIKKGANIKIKDQYGGTALTQAAAKGFNGIVKILIDNGADVNVQRSNGTTALMAACSAGYFEIVKTLVLNGADLEAKTDEATALYFAVEGKHIKIVQYLLDRNVNVNYRILPSGFSPLMKAANDGSVEIVKLLLKHNANINLRNNELKTALDIAELKGQTEIAKLIKNNNSSLNSNKSLIHKQDLRTKNLNNPNKIIIVVADSGLYLNNEKLPVDNKIVNYNKIFGEPTRVDSVVTLTYVLNDKDTVSNTTYMKNFIYIYDDIGIRLYRDRFSDQVSELSILYDVNNSSDYHIPKTNFKGNLFLNDKSISADPTVSLLNDLGFKAESNKIRVGNYNIYLDTSSTDENKITEINITI